MKITFILPYVGISGGVRSTFELANRLQDRGHTVSVVYPLIPMRHGTNWYNLRGLIHRTMRVITNFKQGRRVEWFDLKVNLMRVPTLAERYIPKGDIVVAIWWETAYFIAKYNKNKGEKFYFIRHYETWGGPEDAVNKTYTLPLYKVVTSIWLKTLIEKKFNVLTFGPIPNGINFDLFYKTRNGFKCHNPKRIGMVYSRRKWKGMDDGLKAFYTAKKKHPDIKLVLFGEPKGEEVGEDIEFHRFPSKDKLRELYNSLDIFIFPSHHEGFGNPPMEAMACGVACLATRVGAVPDYIISGRTGLVCLPHASNKIAECLVYLLGNEEERKEMAKAGHKYIQRFSWDKSVNQLEEVFTQVLKSRERTI